MLLHDLPQPANDMEWRQLYREMGPFFAAKVFTNRTPQVVLDLPVSTALGRACGWLRAVCDERITLPLKAFRDCPDIYSSLSSSLGQDAAVEVKMAWRCNTEQWWTARLKPEYAGPLYRKLGYPELGNWTPQLPLALRGSWTRRCRPSLRITSPLSPPTPSSASCAGTRRRTCFGRGWNAVWSLSSVSP